MLVVKRGSYGRYDHAHVADVDLSLLSPLVGLDASGALQVLPCSEAWHSDARQLFQQLAQQGITHAGFEPVKHRATLSSRTGSYTLQRTFDLSSARRCPNCPWLQPSPCLLGSLGCWLLPALASMWLTPP